MSGISQKIADQLKAAREAKNLTQADVARGLKIRASVIEMIERGNLSNLPGSFYIYGYIKQYSDFLGLESKDMLGELKEARNNVLKDEDFILHGDPTNYEIKPSNTIVFFCMLSCIAIYYFWYLGDGKYTADMNKRIVERQEEIFHQVSKKQESQE